MISKMLANPNYVYMVKAILALKKVVRRFLVAHAGFEPAISSLRGRCPKPLDECATLFPV